LIFMVRDKIDTEKDTTLVKHIFSLHSNTVNVNIHKNVQNEDILDVEFLRK